SRGRSGRPGNSPVGDKLRCASTRSPCPAKRWIAATFSSGSVNWRQRRLCSLSSGKAFMQERFQIDGRHQTETAASAWSHCRSLVQSQKSTGPQELTLSDQLKKYLFEDQSARAQIV